MLYRTLTGKPRGWSEDATWKDPDGVVSQSAILGVAWTENAGRGRWRRILGTHTAGGGNPYAGARPDESAMAHEFGHLLDKALGGGKRADGGEARAASQERLWRLVHGKMVREGGGYQNPYFRQKGDAGPEEFWADAFGVWARGSDAPVTDGAGQPTRLGASYGKHGGRVITWRVRALAEAYDVPWSVGFEISDYFDRLHREVKSGKRKTRLRTKGY
jgi:hypothetical protein